MRGRLPLDGGVEREDHLLDVIRPNPLDKAGEVQILGADAIERRQGAAEHMIAHIQNLRTFERPEIGDRLDDDQRLRITLPIRE